MSRDAGKWLVAGLFLGLGLGTGGWLLHRAAQGAEPVQPTELFRQVLSHVRRFGVDSLGEEELLRRAATGLVRELDDEFASLRPAGRTRPVPADAGGLGLLLTARGGPMVVLGVLPGSPADSAGIAPGDQLLEVGQRPVDGLGRDGVRDALDGAPGQPLRLLLRRPRVGQVVEFTLHRGTPASVLVHEAVDLGGVWYLRLPLIGPGAARQVAERVEAVVSAGGGRLLLDLRGASSGDLDEALGIAGVFLGRGTPVVTIRGATAETRQATSPGFTAPEDLLVAVLVDGSTADAAEVVAGALQDHDRALVVGVPSFGRGRSQQEFTLDERTVIRLSTTRWETPSGRPIQPDSVADSLEARPVFQTDGGRRVRGGGGIVPDSLVPSPGPGEADLAFLRAVAGSLPELAAAVREAGLANPGGAPGALVREVAASLRRAGVTVADGLLRGAEPMLAREAARWAALRRGGWPEVARVAAAADPLIVAGTRILRAASAPDRLVGLGGG